MEFTGFSITQNDEQIMNNQIDEGEWVGPVAGKTVCKISIWRQRQRLRVYMNEEKVWDLPRALESGKKYNSILFSLQDDVNAERYGDVPWQSAAGGRRTRYAQ